ncbi:MAG TPA: hypothetical protein PKL49_11540 [Steroidobacteraceae bacterium]|jgi:hypothetical protein|nr:hypothetical protein [Steroidobacteraceae bacterium]HNS27765.1 hypothetical protein [Steroidobacteraceae bacterium]
MESNHMRQLDGQRRSAGRPNLKASVALDEFMSDLESLQPRDASARRSLDEARTAWQAREEIRAGHARTLTVNEVEHELDLGPA